MLGGFLLRFFATVVALAVATIVLPGISMSTHQLATEVPAMVAVAVIFGTVNSGVKPLFRFRNTPGYLIVLAAALLLVNAGLLLLTSWVCSLLRVPWTVDGFLPALMGGFIVSVVSFLANALFGTRGVEHR